MSSAALIYRSTRQAHVRGLRGSLERCQAQAAARVPANNNSTLAPNNHHHRDRSGLTAAPGTHQDVPPELPPFGHSKPFRFTQPPNPSWKLGQKSRPSVTHDATEDMRKRWDMESTTPRDAYKLMTSAIVPRPIALVSTLSNEGIANLAPFSYFSMISHNPPMVSVSFSMSKRRPKDTRDNILSTKQFTVNIISDSFVEAANSTSVESPASMDEWVIGGLTPEPSVFVKPSLVRESSIGMECELYSFQDICAPKSSQITTTVVFGLIKYIHVRESVLDASKQSVDPAKLRPVSRLGGARYGRLTEAFELERIDWNNLGDTYNGLLG
ncbi:hypothetical protein FA13DRAFT_1726740 [Coprinellus micaceus]|uniref:Flavin reductase like domain-containing protein n=1 Tax=Coprinellus micaceus TaxID=71717 RepID=A0A4Y7TVN5_COPMI|nr:hypothetical protein FA13DRAFT_1726740 [Coprinellus micaceus]